LLAADYQMQAVNVVNSDTRIVD